MLVPFMCCQKRLEGCWTTIASSPNTLKSKSCFAKTFPEKNFSPRKKCHRIKQQSTKEFSL